MELDAESRRVGLRGRSGRAVQAVEGDRQGHARRGQEKFARKSSGRRPLERSGYDRGQATVGMAKMMLLVRGMFGFMSATLMSGMRRDGMGRAAYVLAMRGGGEALQRQQQRQQYGKDRPFAMLHGP